MENNYSKENYQNFSDQVENLLQQNLLPQALTVVEKRLKQFPLDTDTNVIACDVLVRMGRLDDVRGILSKFDDLISGLYAHAGDIYQKHGFTSDAVICYRKSIVLNPTAGHAKEIREKLILCEQEEPQQEDMVEPDDLNLPRPEFYTVTLADLYIKQGHLQMAAEVLQDIIRKEPANVQARAKFDTVKAAIALKTMADSKTANAGELLNILSSWLENVSRIKEHAT
jgi:tetratricopeptide (TPR) repeat protein